MAVPLVSCAPTTIASASPATITTVAISGERRGSVSSPPASRRSSRYCASPAPTVTSTSSPRAIAPSRSRVETLPVSAVTLLNGTAATAAKPAKQIPRTTAHSCSRRRMITTSAIRPAAHANSAPRENDTYSPIPSGAAAAAAVTRSQPGRVRSPATPAASTSPSAASSPIAFQ